MFVGKQKILLEDLYIDLALENMLIFAVVLVQDLDNLRSGG